MSEITGLGSRVGYADALVAAGGPTVYTMVSGVHKITPPAGPAAQTNTISSRTGTIFISMCPPGSLVEQV